MTKTKTANGSPDYTWLNCNRIVEESPKQTARNLGYAVADRTHEAYSYETYGEGSWRDCGSMLAQRGLDERQIEAVLRSKWTRWAADMANTDRPTSVDLARFLDDPRNRCTPAAIAQLVAETFPEGADLAGNCEGEQIADLIDLAIALSKTNSPLAPKAIALVNEIKARRAA